MQSITSVLHDYLNAAYRELEDGNILIANTYVYCYNRLSLEVDNERMLLLKEDKYNRTWHIFNLHKAEFYRRVFNE